MNSGVVILVDPCQVHTSDPHRHLQPDLYHQKNHYHTFCVTGGHITDKTIALSEGEQMVNSVTNLRMTLSSWSKIL